MFVIFYWIFSKFSPLTNTNRSLL